MEPPKGQTVSGAMRLVRIWEGSKGRREGTGVAAQPRCTEPEESSLQQPCTGPLGI